MFLVNSDAFQPGDSGSVIFTRSADKKIAIAMLKGSWPPPQQRIYDAVPLGNAIEEIEKEYQHLMKGLKIVN